MDDVARIAAGLTPSQRKVMLDAYETVFMDRMKCGGKMKSLRELSLTTQAWRGGDLLTTLGEAVRRYLEENPDA